MNADLRQLSMLSANEELLEKLTAVGGRFVIVGSVAVHFYFNDRNFDDLDLLIDPTEANAVKVMAALSSPMFTLPFTAQALTRTVHLPVKTYFYADFITPRPGQDFSSFWGDANLAKVRSVEVRVASIRALKEMLATSSEAKHQRDRERLDAIE